MDSSEAELSIVLTDDPGIEALNRQYRNRPSPTNVLAFPMQEGEFAGIQPDILGDVVISIQTAAMEASDLGVTVADRFKFLLIHGILHLMGFDHEAGDKEEQLMEEKSAMLFEMIQSMKIEVA